MATIVAAQTGNWSATSTWTGGVVPGVNDVARINGAFVVTIDQNISVQGLEINNASGYFNMTSVYNIVCSGDISSLITNLGARGILISASSGSMSITASNIYGREGANGVELAGNCNLDIYAVLTMTNVSANGAGASLLIKGSGAVTIHTDLPAAGPLRSVMVDASAAPTVTINSNVVSPTTTGTAPTIQLRGSGAVVVINGNVTGSVANNGYGAIYIDTNAVSLNLTINGNVSSVLYPAIISATAGTATGNITINGIVESSGTFPAIQSPAMGLTISAQSAIWGSSTAQPVYGPNFRLTPNTNHSIQMRDTNNAVVTLSNFSANQPAVGDVRQGTTYGPGLSNTGTLVVPNPASVAKNVPTDNTVGTAVLTPSNVWDHEISSGVQAKARLLANATNAGVAAQLEAALSG